MSKTDPVGEQRTVFSSPETDAKVIESVIDQSLARLGVGEQRVSEAFLRETLKAAEWTKTDCNGEVIRMMAKELIALRAQSAAALRVSNEPPAHWKENDGWKRHPQTREEWNWREDKQSRLERAVKRLNFCSDQADPSAPDQMTTVLRLDLMIVLGQLVQREAQHRFWKAKREEEASQSAAAAEEMLPTPPTKHSMNEDGDLFYDNDEVEEYIQAVEDWAGIPRNLAAPAAAVEPKCMKRVPETGEPCDLEPTHSGRHGAAAVEPDRCQHCGKTWEEHGEPNAQCYPDCTFTTRFFGPAAAVEEEKPVKLMEHFVGGVTICPQCGKAATASHICVASFAYDPKLAPEHLDPETGGAK